MGLKIDSLQEDDRVDHKARKSQVSDDLQRKLNPTFMKCRRSNYFLLSTNFFMPIIYKYTYLLLLFWSSVPNHQPKINSFFFVYINMDASINQLSQNQLLQTKDYGDWVEQSEVG